MDRVRRSVRGASADAPGASDEALGGTSRPHRYPRRRCAALVGSPPVDSAPRAAASGLVSLTALLGLDNLRVAPARWRSQTSTATERRTSLSTTGSNNKSVFMGRGDWTFASPVLLDNGTFQPAVTY
jgi:hypothetical protein